MTLLIVNCLQGCVSLKKGIFIFQGQISSKRFRVAVSWDERWFHKWKLFCCLVPDWESFNNKVCCYHISNCFKCKPLMVLHYAVDVSMVVCIYSNRTGVIIVSGVSACPETWINSLLNLLLRKILFVIGPNLCWGGFFIPILQYQMELSFFKL